MKQRIALGIGLLLILAGCKVTFNTTGGPVDTSISTIYISNFINEAEIVVPYLAQTTTERIQERFLNQSRLSLSDEGSADVTVSGSVEDYRVSSVAVQGTQAGTAQNRLTIRVRVKFDNRVKPDESWEQSFTGFIDFNADIDFSSVERARIEDVLEQITQDIFNRSLGKW